MRLAIAATLIVAMAGCSAGAKGKEELLVSAASSLTEALDDVEAAFELEHPGLDVILNTGGSSQLREQILGGAPVDVFASASPEIMSEVESLIVGPIEVFASNTLEIAVPVGNPGGVNSLGDFADDSLLIGLCAPDVPCGVYARRILQAAGVEAAVDSEEPNARALLVKLENGDLDAGIVYRSDVLSNEQVEVISIPDEVNLVTSYEVAVLSSGSNRIGAEDLVGFLLSERGRQILAGHGFGLP